MQGRLEELEKAKTDNIPVSKVEELMEKFYILDKELKETINENEVRPIIGSTSTLTHYLGPQDQQPIALRRLPEVEKRVRSHLNIHPVKKFRGCGGPLQPDGQDLK